ncbi:golgi integral membrane protein [Terfezia boudieri ATCC MYA-4762]|uniref:Protein BTN n=1 Tax=Terfezia boudieri ATCC MYA-4762 TaxID=1051890 RepID=A0A3N4LS02_9PEZI|nr:golgi integral membrane protein [Terfezia boudieri ATCC MYA-4762]
MASSLAASRFTLPLPGSPSSNMQLFKARLKALFADADPRVCLAFWLFGLINNVLYVIILSAALDLVGPTIPKSLVLLFDVLPSFLTKLLLPYVIHRVPYHLRIPILVLLSFLGMQFVAYAPTLAWRMFGVVVASIASGAGELSFLGLTHYYGQFALASWGSGTGAAGLVGAGMYSVVITGWRWSVRGALGGFSFLPGVMLLAFFAVLPKGVLWYRRAPGEGDAEDGVMRHREEEEGEGEGQGEGLNTRRRHSTQSIPSLRSTSTSSSSFLPTFYRNLARTKSLFFPYMLPLLLVYIAEYTINQGHRPPHRFTHFRDFYPTYNTIYQLGVFISRSSHLIYRLPALYPPSLLQCLNLIILTLHAMYPFIPTVWIVFVVIFWEGLLGGSVYVNTFAKITEEVGLSEREFALGAVTVADSGGICIAGFVGLWLEGALCRWQVGRGREWCRLME